jgi:threonine dehydrogenase-like Zn-dependent dehydrogenase
VAALFEHIRNGYLKPSDIVTHRIPLEHIAEGLPHLLGQARRLHQAAHRPDPH